MRHHWFGPAVRVETANPGQPSIVNSVEKAAEQLFGWSVRGPEWHRAVDCCAEALTGHMPAAQVRAAFIDAAVAAGRLVDPSAAVRILQPARRARSIGRLPKRVVTARSA
ncbi:MULTISPECIES: DUF982 domain-containing protein [unclassified Bosea (in: a-proteobacteria)]|uniref:DUF982 domain-containing protein n=1 Tax=Bosea sp. Tri-49 TaxID=1867715 RepID=UPI000F7E06C4